MSNLLPLTTISKKSFHLTFLALTLTLTLFSTISTTAQTPCCTLQGTLQDATTSTPLTGATVFVVNTTRGTTTDTNGHYTLALERGTYTVIYSFIGYYSDTVTLTLQQPVTHAIKLRPVLTTIQEVTVSDERTAAERLNQTETGLITIHREDMEHLPYLLGEADPIRLIQLMPGIQSAGEGSTGFYVRGGALDQNLMMLDHSTVYNPSHMFGFFSIFNGSTLDNIDLYKSGIPAYYGGRLSSVTRVTTRKGSAEKLKGEGAVGLIAANVLVEGPIKKNKGSFMVAARRTYVDLFAKGLRELSILRQNINYYFYDLNVNADYSLSPHDQLSLRGYLGKDHFTYNTSSFSNRIEWTNTAGSLSWKHTWDNGLFSELAINTSLYDMSLGAAISSYNFSIASDIKDHGLTYQFNLKRGAHDLTWGATYTLHSVRPNNIAANSSEVELTFTPSTTLHGEEGALYFNDKIQIGSRTEVSAGIRYSGYRHTGSFTRYIEDENFQVLDTVQYSKGKTIKAYANPEPRVAIRYSLTSNSALKASFDRTYQYMHMAPLSSVSLPLDIWVPSSAVIRPQSANQYSAGYYRNFDEPALETSVVGYYKSMDRQIEYREGVIIGYSKGYNFDDNFVFGKGTSYGIELLLKKTKGRLNGQVAYTLSKTTRTFPDLNDGKPFTAKYDRRHDLSVFGNFTYNKRWTFSGVFVFATGNALNLPVARYIIQGNVVNEYGERNAFRMPPYHRLDLAATYVARKTERYETSWVFSIYNVYSRRNPYYIYFQTEGDLNKYELKTSIKQVSLFPILPAVTYRIKF